MRVRSLEGVSTPVTVTTVGGANTGSKVGFESESRDGPKGVRVGDTER